MNVAERIKEIRNSLFDGSNKKFAEALGENPNTTSNWVNRGASGEVLEKIIKVLPEINVAWILTGEGEMLRNSEQGNVVNPQFSKLDDEYFNLLNNGEMTTILNTMLTVISRQSSQIDTLISQHDRLITELEKSGARTDRAITMIEHNTGGAGAQKKEAV